MKTLISALAVAAVMGIAAAATPASAADLSASYVAPAPVATGANNCVVVNDGHYNFGEQQCTRKYPWWYTPVSWKNHNGGNTQTYTKPTPDPSCDPHHDKPHHGGWKPHDGGYKPHDGGYKPRDGGYKPHNGGWKPQNGGYNPSFH